MSEAEELVVAGYHFNSKADADKARDEQKKIAYIEAHMNMDNPESVLAIYEKMLSNKIFITPVGLDFLKEIRDYLMSRDEIENERIKPLELNRMYSLGQATPDKEAMPKRRVVPTKKKNPYEERFFISFVFNIILVIAVIAMFVIATTSKNPNIINYENNIVNRYAGWEEDLKEREQKIREEERRLGITEQSSGSEEADDN